MKEAYGEYSYTLNVIFNLFALCWTEASTLGILNAGRGRG